jgi:hypothetical protein
LKPALRHHKYNQLVKSSFCLNERVFATRPFFKLDAVANEGLLNVLESDALLSASAVPATKTDLPIEMYYPSARNQYSKIYLYFYYKYPNFFQFLSTYTTWFYEQWSFSADFFINILIAFIVSAVFFKVLLPYLLSSLFSTPIRIILPLLMGKKFTEILYQNPPPLLPFQLKMINESYNKFLANDPDQRTYIDQKWNGESYRVRPVYVCSNCSSVMNTAMKDLPKPDNYLEFNQRKEILSKPDISKWKKNILKFYDKLSKISFTNNVVFRSFRQRLLFDDDSIFYCIHCKAGWEHFYNRYDPFDIRALKKWIIIHPEDHKEIDEFIASVEPKYSMKSDPEKDSETEETEENDKSEK